VARPAGVEGTDEGVGHVENVHEITYHRPVAVDDQLRRPPLGHRDGPGDEPRLVTVRAPRQPAEPTVERHLIAQVADGPPDSVRQRVVGAGQPVHLVPVAVQPVGHG
jgi:hypothetical protein